VLPGGFVLTVPYLLLLSLCVSLSQINKDMEKTLGTLNKMLKATPVERVHMNMKELTRVFDNLSINTNTMVGALGEQGPSLTATDEEISHELASLDAEFNVELKTSMPAASSALPQIQESVKVQDDLGARLAALKGK
jgi:hypothetical protein